MDCSCIGPPAPGVDLPCPYLMSDGRAFTQYDRACPIRGGGSSFETRQTLIRNADRFMQEERECTMRKLGCRSCFPLEAQGTVMPDCTVVTCNERSCSVRLADACGLGVKRDYGSNAPPLQGFETPIYKIGGVPDGTSRLARIF